MVDDDLAGVAPWGFDPGQVRPPVLFLHGAQDRMVPSSHGEWLAHRTPSAELWLRPDDGHVSVLGAAEAALGWLWERARQGLTHERSSCPLWCTQAKLSCDRRRSPPPGPLTCPEPIWEICVAPRRC
jgi:hypothetical protein